MLDRAAQWVESDAEPAQIPSDEAHEVSAVLFSVPGEPRRWSPYCGEVPARQPLRKRWAPVERCGPRHSLGGRRRLAVRTRRAPFAIPRRGLHRCRHYRVVALVYPRSGWPADTPDPLRRAVLLPRCEYRGWGRRIGVAECARLPLGP